jgi:hypothetical protein
MAYVENQPDGIDPLDPLGVAKSVPLVRWETQTDGIDPLDPSGAPKWVPLVHWESQPYEARVADAQVSAI